MRRAIFSSAILIASCTPSGGTVPPAALGDDAYCALAAEEGLVILRAGVLTRCGLERGEHDEEGSTACQHSRVGSDGALTALDVGDATDVLATADGALIVRFSDGRLVRREGTAEELLAGWATDPSLVGDRLAYVAAPSDALIEDGEPAPGTPLEVVVREGRGAPEVFATDETAASPFALPDGSGVAFTSTRTGVASVFVAERGGPALQLTNVGAETVGQGFVPAPDRELVFVPGSLRAVFTAHYDEDRIWMIDLANGSAEELGPGRLPLLDGQEVRVADPGAGSSGCVRRIPLGERP